MSARPVYVYRLRVDNVDALPKWPDEPDSWVEVFAKHGWHADVYDIDSQGFQWPDSTRHYLSRSAAHRRAAFLRDLGAEVTVERSERVRWET